MTMPPWQQIYQRFNPIQKLQGETLDYFVARDPQLLESIATELRFASDSYQVLFVGQRGSGKSSELRRLAQLLGEEFVTVLVDVDELTDLFNVNHVEVLYLLGVSIYGAARIAGYELDEALIEELVDSIETLVREQTEKDDFTIDVPALLSAITTTAAAAAVGGTVAGPAGATAGMLATAVTIFKGIKFTLGVSDKVVRRLEVKPQITTIVKALNQIVSAVSEKSGRKVLAIIDGLDRVETEQGRVIFAESQVLTQPDCHLIYVIPSNLYYSPYLVLAKQVFQKVHFLPNIKLHEKGKDKPYEPGFELMHKVVDRRLADMELNHDALFSKDALTLLIKMSGGLMRELVRLVQSSILGAAVRDAERVELDAAHSVVDDLRRDYQAGLTQPLIEELVQLAKSGQLSGTAEGGTLLQNLYVLCQSNKLLWYEVHPVLVSFIHDEMAKKGVDGNNGD